LVASDGARRDSVTMRVVPPSHDPRPGFSVLRQ
jgi:hypothetical protein